MPFNLKGRNFLSLLDFSPYEINHLLNLSMKLKRDKMAGISHKLLADKNIALIFEKRSTRTRSAFVVACNDEGANPEFLGKNDLQFGKKESVKDTARVLGRFFDGIEFRGYKHKTVVELAKWAGVPVWNGLTDLHHPTQILADMLTIKEEFGCLEGINVSYVGDGRNNMANSLLIGFMKMGMNFKIVAPESLFPAKKLLEQVDEICKETGGTYTLTEDVKAGVEDANVLYTDVWVSTGDEGKWDERLEMLMPYQVNAKMASLIKDPNWIFMHCLPAFHNNETDLSKDTGALEVTEEIFEGPHSRVFDEAENRMHTIKAVMVATLGNQ
ncbi:MAG: ornithine carbamoyltransferase [Myxococcota bacterium]